jgi:predicted KAP-like P-loop ATPase
MDKRDIKVTLERKGNKVVYMIPYNFIWYAQYSAITKLHSLAIFRVINDKKQSKSTLITSHKKVVKKSKVKNKG